MTFPGREASEWIRDKLIFHFFDDVFTLSSMEIMRGGPEAVEVLGRPLQMLGYVAFPDFVRRCVNVYRMTIFELDANFDIGAIASFQAWLRREALARGLKSRSDNSPRSPIGQKNS